MRTPTKFVSELTEEQKKQLQAVLKSNAPQRTRMRAHAVLLSARRFSIDQIASIYEVDRDRVSQWLEWWRDYGFDGLGDEPRTGRPPKLSVEDETKVIEFIKAEPRSVRQAVSEIERELKKK